VSREEYADFIPQVDEDDFIDLEYNQDVPLPNDFSLGYRA